MDRGIRFTIDRVDSGYWNGMGMDGWIVHVWVVLDQEMRMRDDYYISYIVGEVVWLRIRMHSHQFFLPD